MADCPIAVSVGDPSGIGPDIILKAWKNRNASEDLPDFFVAGSIKSLSERSDLLGLNTEFTAFDSSAKISKDKLSVLDIGQSVTGSPGKPSLGDASGTTAAIDMAVSAVIDGLASAVVTCPINKHVLYEGGFKHPGHTEYLGELAQRHTGKRYKPVMMLAGPELRTVPVTIHIPLCDVPAELTGESIMETTMIVSADLQKRFDISQPRIAIAGLNPHAGENGDIGREEIEFIAPAVAALRKQNIDVRGPLPADTMFHAAARKTYDVAICMYHDQALIPAKMLGFDDAVNVTLGLPFIRTSPDHGTAYDIAGTGSANPSSFVAALKMAAEMAECT
ncbi:MAG: 4-hydroxythreonine-4-phosphate dehydrogenase PdxA [Pseudomonadota bacterium]